mgnify:CR=1 FL=1
MNAILEPRIIFTDDQLLILDKPAGWLTHPSGRSETPSVTEWLLDHYPSLATVGPPEQLQDGTMISRAGILHRLDRETSGVIAAAKTKEAFNWFTKAFRERKVDKVYRAIVSGVVKLDDGVIDLPVGRSRKDPRRRVASKRAHGELRSAVTHFRVLERFVQHTYLELKPETGRTHQLRVHLKAIHAPILGDELYASPRLAGLGLALPTINRMALHAFSLTLPWPNGEKKYFESPLPEDLQKTLDSLRESC